uniref:Uncharacterized protein n=1 Tax=Anguilla anguilla TaxID=7936 RepID=A0A0E9XYZ8_ANGAN
MHFIPVAISYFLHTISSVRQCFILNQLCFLVQDVTEFSLYFMMASLETSVRGVTDEHVNGINLSATFGSCNA